MKWHKLFFRHSEPALFAGVESHLFESFYKNWEVKGEKDKSNNQNQ